MQRRLRSVRRRVYAWLAQALTAVALRIPFRALRVLCRGVFTPLLAALLWRTAHAQLEQVLAARVTPRERRKILWSVFSGCAGLLAEWLGFTRAGPAFLARWVDEGDGRARIHALERSWPGGWIGVTGHIGNWELLGQWLHHIALRPMGGSIAKRQPNPHLNRVIERLRGRWGMATLYRDASPVDTVRVLRSGSAIGVVPDQDVESLAGVFVDFLGRPAYTPVGPARLALAARVPLVVGFMLRDGGRFRVQINDPIWPDPSRPRQEEILRLTKEWSRQIEAMVLRHPEQWPWFHRRWKTTPQRLAERQRRRWLPNRDSRTG